MKNVLIIGAGPAGLTAAYKLLKSNQDIDVTILEASENIGGISRTYNYKNNRMDIGGHRFFSKDKRVTDLWNEIMPMQGKPAKDDIILNNQKKYVEGGPDPEKEDRVMLLRRRVSRIFFLRKFFDYPISMKFETFKNMGLKNTWVAGWGYIESCLHKRKETNLENFYINRFGKPLYKMFFEDYTENLWGRHPSEISPEWGAQRVKGLSIKAILKDMMGKLFKKKNRIVETSLIEEFAYPKLGPGQLWELTASDIKKKGGSIVMEAKVTGVVRSEEGSITEVTYIKDGVTHHESCDYFISSMPVKDLVMGMEGVPDKYTEIAKGLPYRDYMTVGVLVYKLNLKNNTKIKTVGNIVPDDWVYVHDRSVKMGRFQIYNNWSPYMVKDLENTIWMGLEYFCNEGDNMWAMSDEEFAHMAIREMVTIGLIDREQDVKDFHVERVKKAYPAYFDTYEHMDELRDYLNTIPNLFCVGRNGQHRYNNLDHSMCTSFETVKNILQHVETKDNIWNVNTEKEYHEKA